MPGRRRTSPAGLPKTKRGSRAVLAILAAVIGLFSVTDTLANVVTKVDPARAHVLAPWDGKITASAAQQSFTASLASEPASEPARLARLALLQDPTATDALTVLGLQAQLRGDTEQARRVFAHSLELSRRELRPRIWAIEEAVGRGDIAGALRNYDVALRTSRRAPELLFPILASAIAEPKVRSALLGIMAQEPVWRESFVDYAAASAVDPQAAVRFFREGERVGLPVDDVDRAGVVNALAARELFDEAWRYYASFRPGVTRDRSRDADFSRAPEAPAVFDWTVSSDTGLSAAIQRGEDGGLVDFAASPSSGGTALQQTQLLPPGTYRLEGHSIGIEQPERSLPYWTLTCRDGRELGRIIVANPAQADGNFSGRFTVPSECPVQTLSLVIRPSDEIAGIAGQIDRVRLVPDR